MKSQYSKISLALAGSISAISFLAGCVATWLFFCADWSYRFSLGSGSRADWVSAGFAGLAAAATLWIGRGANRLAANSLSLKMRERCERDLADVEARIAEAKAVVTGLEGWASQIGMAARFAGNYQFGAADPADIRFALDEIQRVLRSPPWGVPDFRVLEEPEVRALMDTERTVGNAQAWVAGAIKYFDETPGARAGDEHASLSGIGNLLEASVHSAKVFAAHSEMRVSLLVEKREQLRGSLQRFSEGLPDN